MELWVLYVFLIQYTHKIFPFVPWYATSLSYNSIGFNTLFPVITNTDFVILEIGPVYHFGYVAPGAGCFYAV